MYSYATWESEYRDDADFVLEQQARDEAMAARELELERQQLCEWALREYLMLGGRSDFVKHLASECGISWDRVTGG